MIDSTALAADLRHALDPAAFVEDALGITLDPWQVDVLRSQSPRLLLNCCRQSGKSTVVAARAVHKALYWPGSLVLMLSPSQRQSGELFRKALDVYRALPNPVPAASESALRLELSNGSRIISLPGQEGTIRGFSGVDLLCIDEASRVPSDLYAAVRPMLAVSGGQLIAPSTPWGRRGWWSDAWHARDDNWQRVEITAHQCPRITDEFLDEEYRTLGEFWFRQEYMCEFLDPESSAFRSEDIDAAFSEELEPWSLLPATT